MQTCEKHLRCTCVLVFRLIFFQLNGNKGDVRNTVPHPYPPIPNQFAIILTQIPISSLTHFLTPTRAWSHPLLRVCF